MAGRGCESCCQLPWTGRRKGLKRLSRLTAGKRQARTLLKTDGWGVAARVVASCLGLRSWDAIVAASAKAGVGGYNLCICNVGSWSKHLRGTLSASKFWSSGFWIICWIIVWIYFQLILNWFQFTLNLISIYFQLISLWFQFYFSLRSIDFNWFQFTFNWVSNCFQLISIYSHLIFNWYSFTVNWFSIYFQVISNCSHLIFNWCQLMSIYFPLIFNWFQFTFNWFQFTFHLFSIDCNVLSIDFRMISTYFEIPE